MQFKRLCTWAAFSCASLSLSLSISAQAPAAAAPEQNLLALGAGALTVVAPVSYNTAYNWSPDALIDEQLATGWATRGKDLSPKTFVFQLAEKSSITSLGFDSAKVERAATSAKDVKVEIADAEGGPFTPIATLALAQAKDHQRFPLKAPATGRFIRLTVSSNYGDAQNIELMSFNAYGKQLTKRTFADMSGTYSASYGKFHIQQTGAAVSGCYEPSGLIEDGGFDGRVMHFRWSEGSGPGPREGGLAVLVFSDDGKSFTGHYFTDKSDGAPRGIWSGKFMSKEIGTCPNWKADKNGVEDALNKDGRVRLYGILFDTDSDHLKPESKTTLDALVATARAHAGWNFEIEGHTDNVGGDAHNATLSDKRAASVKAYLVAAGINAGRFTTHGYGATRPVASNDTELGRSQNRRVEVVKK